MNATSYDLPPGVIHGDNGKFYAPCDVVRTLPDEMWTAHWTNGNHLTHNSFAGSGLWYEVRPAAANPLQPLPEHTFKLPDGELACYRRDAAKLREAGATLRTMTGITPAADYDRHHPKHVLLVEFPAPPKTDVIDTRLAFDRVLPDGKVITWTGEDRKGAWYSTTPEAAMVIPVHAATVEVLATDGAL